MIGESVSLTKIVKTVFSRKGGGFRDEIGSFDEDALSVGGTFLRTEKDFTEHLSHIVEMWVEFRQRQKP